MDAWNKFEYMVEVMGAENLLDELAKALSTDELMENLEYIARNNDIEI